MKTTLTTLLLSALLFIGCDQESEITSPLSDSPNQQLKVQSVPTLTNSQPVFAPEIYITDRDVNAYIIGSKIINGETGGELLIDTTYINYQGRLLYVYGKLEIEDHSFLGTTEFTMILKPEEASIKLFPHMVFKKEVKLKVDYKGIDLKALGHIASGYIDFAFFGDNGEIELILNQFCEVDIQDERILVDAAELHHFSRYGWVR